MSDKKNILLALDPSTKCTGYALFVNGTLEVARSIKADEKASRWERQRFLANELKTYLACLPLTTVTSEEPMVQGRNGLALHKLLGAIEVSFPNNPVDYIHPSTVKKLMGSGKLDKLEVALAAGRLVKTDAEQELIAELITAEDFDATDAVAIGLCYLMKEMPDAT